MTDRRSWTCSVGEIEGQAPAGSAEALTEAVRVAYERILGRLPKYIVCAWEPTDPELAKDLDFLFEEGQLRFLVYDVPDVVTLTAAQLCVQDGDITEALLRSGQATKVTPGRQG